jgi:hypothetical protein
MASPKYEIWMGMAIAALGHQAGALSGAHHEAVNTIVLERCGQGSSEVLLGYQKVLKNRRGHAVIKDGKRRGPCFKL